MSRSRRAAPVAPLTRALCDRLGITVPGGEAVQLELALHRELAVLSTNTALVTPEPKLLVHACIECGRWGYHLVTCTIGRLAT